ncbi:MAG: hypothetical protein V4463_11920 [Pseudomonadota bacterium]
MNTHPIAAAALGAALLCTQAWAQQATPEMVTDAATAARQKQEVAHRDPARWHQEDRTYSAKLHTLRKEIAAAYKEEQNACRSGPVADRASCLYEAKGIYEHDMRDAREQVVANR